MAIGKVIKGGDPAPVPEDRPVLRPPRAGVVSGEVFEAQNSAKEIIEAAKRQAAEIIEAANREKEEIFKKARESGRQEGIAQAGELITRAKIQAGEIVAASESDVVALACKVAEKIIGADLERKPDVVVNICATAIEQLRQAKAAVLRVNPRDGKILRENFKRLMELVGKSMDITIKDDNEVSSGGCILQTEFGTLDAQLTTQFEMLKQVLMPDTGKKEGPA